MSNIPSVASTVFWGVNTTFFWSGANYKAVSDLTLKYGNKIHEEATTGTSNPYLGTGVYHGEVSVTSLGSSDNSMWSAAATSSGIVPTMGMQWIAGDTQGAPATHSWVASGKVESFQMKWSKDGVVKFDLKMILAAPPVVT